MLLPNLISAQSNFFISPRACGKAGVGVSESDSWGAIVNPAGSARLHTSHVAISYNLPYFVDELSSKSVSSILPFKFGVVSASANQYGFSLYQENKFNLSFAKSLTPELDVAFQFNYLHTYLSQSGSGGQLFSGIGLQYAALDNLVLACYVSNPEKATIEINEEKERIPSLFVLGFKWLSSDSFNVSAEVEKQTEIDFLYKLGLEYSIKDRLWIRTGILGRPSIYTMGFGFNVFEVNFDAGIAVNPVLGVSSCFGISYRFKQRR